MMDTELITESFDETKGWSLTATDSSFLAELPDSARLDYAIKLLFYRQEGRFPKTVDRPSSLILGYVADQVAASHSNWKLSHVRTDRRRREIILDYLELQPFDNDASNALWRILDAEASYLNLDETAFKRRLRRLCYNQGFRSPTETWMSRAYNALNERFAEAEYKRIFEAIPSSDRVRMLASLAGEGGPESFSTIRRDITGSGREAFYSFARKLQYINSLSLPDEYLSTLEKDFLEKQESRMRRCEPREIRRFADKRKVAMYAIYLHRSRLSFTDKLLRIMLDSIHSVYERSKRDAKTEAGNKREENYKTSKILTHILTAYQLTPERSVKAVVEELMTPDEVQEWLGGAQKTKSPSAATFEFMRSRWKSYYRPMLRVLLETVEFHTNIASQKTLIEALDWIHLNFDGRRQAHALKDRVPIEGVLTGLPP